jgi:hypothetical protein
VVAYEELILAEAQLELPITIAGKLYNPAPSPVNVPEMYEEF